MARKKRAFYKMKGHTLPGINQRMDKSSNPDGRAKSSAFQQKPSKEELREAANNPNSPNHISKFKTRADYFAWKAGGIVKPKAPERNLTHGEGFTLLNPDGTINEEATKSQLANYNRENNTGVK